MFEEVKEKLKSIETKINGYADDIAKSDNICHKMLQLEQLKELIDNYYDMLNECYQFTWQFASKVNTAN